jgi:hypothetical protein
MSRKKRQLELEEEEKSQSLILGRPSVPQQDKSRQNQHRYDPMREHPESFSNLFSFCFILEGEFYFKGSNSSSSNFTSTKFTSHPTKSNCKGKPFPEGNNVGARTERHGHASSFE